ncbi:glutathione S-transferase [Thalassotalea insulae]|uniref:Glutathione S-transferase n=1 Tax=Thalassotalea insulae TaxID=2056778 RepID=A0ABQ6GUA4_9GAMM|nr:glutathione S-transferase family protein [Thalassotalea insulae]GLX79526.1 glutathione S-transferase [Thalassotalea insulae]
MSVTESKQCELIFYTNPASRGQIARWMLEEVGVEYRQILLDYDQNMKADEYLAINPMGKVPAISHNGKIVTECAAICAYLADAYPEQGLAPKLNERADYYRWLFFTSGPVEAAIIDKARNIDIPDEHKRMVGYAGYQQTVEVLAQAVSANPYVAGQHFSAADVYVGSHVIWGIEFGSLPKRPEFEDYAAKLKTRAAYLAAKEIDAKLMSEQG